jgi:trans-aconitate methyltransferase
MGRWSRLLAPQFVDWLQCPAGLDWLELGCGTGALTDSICKRADPRSVIACDPAKPFVTFATNEVRDPRVTFVHAGADDFPFAASGGYMSATSLLALNFFPSPTSALTRMCLASAPGASVSACVWDYSEGMQFLRLFWDAAADVSPTAAGMDEGSRFPICTRGNLLDLFVSVGLQDVTCDALVIATVFRDFDDYWQPLTAGVGPAPAFVESLGSEQQDRLRSSLRDRLPFASDGSLLLNARAWAVRGSTGVPGRVVGGT